MWEDEESMDRLCMVDSVLNCTERMDIDLSFTDDIQRQVRLQPEFFNRY